MGVFKKTAMLAIPITLYALFMLVPAAATLQGLQVGMEMPDFSLKGISGAKSSFSDLKGNRLTVIYFWSTWSKNSGKGLTRLENLYRQYGNKGLGVIGINVDDLKIGIESENRIREMKKELGITFPILIDQGLVLFHDTGVIALPTTVIVDENRTIRYELSGYPLLGVEEMADFIAFTIEGKKPELKAAAKGYQPDKQSVRYFNMGQKTLKTRRTADMAEEWFKKAIIADPGFVQPLISLGKFYLQKGDVNAASVQFEQSLKVDPGNVVAMCELAMIKFNLGKSKEASSLFEEALKQDDTYTPCYYYNGYLLGKSGKSGEAARMFDDAVSLNPLDYRIHIYRGRLLEETGGNPQQVAEEYRKALELIMTTK